MVVSMKKSQVLKNIAQWLPEQSTERHDYLCSNFLYFFFLLKENILVAHQI